MDLPLRSNVSDGVVHIEFPTTLTEEGLKAFEVREASAAAAGVKRFLEPASVAVIGASRKRGTIGGEVFANLLRGDYAGPVYPVNPSAPVIQSVAAYPSIGEVPGDVELAVIVVPSAHVLEVARECGIKGVGALLIISSGFAEVGPEGAALQAELMTIAREYGMRIIGPNCMGALSTDPEVRMNATFSPVAAMPGNLAFSSQSGALGIAVIDRANDLGLGLSSFVSVGNKADISGNDLLQYWEQDDRTDVILLYLESFGNPRKFARIARRVSKSKPIVAVKSGRSKAGARAAASHTGSMAAGDVAVDALFTQAGVIRTDTLEELFDVGALLAHQPMPKGKRVAILTNAGGLGILAADACDAGGLEIAELSPDTNEKLEAMLPKEASFANPIDMIASASAEQYGEALGLLLGDPQVDSVIVIFIPPLVTRPEDVAASLMARVGDDDKTVVACFLGVQGVQTMLSNDGVTLPSYTFPEAAARALGKVTRHAEWCRRPEGDVPRFSDIDRAGAIGLVVAALDSGREWLDPTEVADLLTMYGIKAARTQVADSFDEVAKAAASVGRPVAIKVSSDKILHKSDVGGVALNVAPEEASGVARKMAEDLRAEGFEDVDSFLVQEMAPLDGLEMLVGMSLDPSFGPLVGIGAGGVLVELVRDVTYRITPLTNLDVDEMIDSLKMRRLLDGYRGSPKRDVASLRDVALRLSAMVEDLPHLAEVDLNPVLVGREGEGSMVVDARIRVAEPKPPAPRGARSR
jgi:acetyl coenzyme A synthetase (ADP forming)-like protein